MRHWLLVARKGLRRLSAQSNKTIRPTEKGPRKEDRRSKKEPKTIGPVQKGPRKHDRRKNTSKL